MTVREALRAVREQGAEFVEAYGENDLLTRASAVSYQVLFALVPTALAGIALLGFLDLDDVWARDVAPRVEEELSPEAFAVIESSVERILGTQQVFWVTAGVAFALYQVSGAVRATMGGLNSIYSLGEERPWLRRVAVSVALAVVVSIGFGLAVVGVMSGGDLGRRAADGAAGVALGALLGWVLPAALALGAIWTLVRFAPARRPSIPWVGRASAVTVGAWLLVSLAFRWYATDIASYESIFGGLASGIVLMTYLYISANVFLGGYQLDALIRARAGLGRGGGEACPEAS